ncbi:AAA family ATPase [Pelomonas sp. SE-A7]|uniref:AAA family ATPase n=1 Tax=Pelomonas sp. SE-A7 TaxID=3054953 RepID=UPI00259C7740|nr:AAA family ATPase [Pelomonas sp. SE-A7]MDM4766665.1 AAA family ATPase [Pelomonas sp. SE-A7]
MRCADASTWTRPYEDALQPGVIKERGETRGSALGDLTALDIEGACFAMDMALKAVVLVTEQGEAIIRSQIQRALAHAKAVYKDPHAALKATYHGLAADDGVVPTVITGPAGAGKSAMRTALKRTLVEQEMIRIDETHPPVPHVAFAECVVKQQSSMTGVLRRLASPEIAAGQVKVSQAEMPAQCSKWLRICGTCLFGVDETQFIAQSEGASTLVTKVLLGLSELQVPWFVICNYSLIWKLRNRRPAEAQQRLLADPVVLLPDAPQSVDWQRLLEEYQVVLGPTAGFKLMDHPVDLWNYCAGLKRKLRSLLVLAYRKARSDGVSVMLWDHVIKAFESDKYSVARADVNRLIACAGQSGDLRQDLQCPFDGPEIRSKTEVYAAKLREARQGTVSNAAIRASMNAQERRAVEAIEKAVEPPAPSGKVVQLERPKRQRRTLDSLLEAGQDFMASRPNKSGAKP